MAHPTCGAKNRAGSPCKQPAGWGTDHPGQGRCKLHGGKSLVKHGRYSTIQRPRIKELLQQFENDPNPLDLLPETQLLRALITDFIERWDHYTDLTHTWHAMYTKAYRDAVDEWREKMIQLLEDGGYENTTTADLPPVPDPADYAPEKPRQLLDITAAATLVDKVGAMIDRIEKHKREGAITLDTLNRVLEQLGVEVVHAAQEVIRDAATRAALLHAIERRWGTIRLDTIHAAPPRPPQGARDLN